MFVIPSDARRADRIETVTSDPDHAYSNFRTGACVGVCILMFSQVEIIAMQFRREP